MRAQRKTELIIKSIIQQKGHEVSKIQQEELAKLQNERDKYLIKLKDEKKESKLQGESKRKQMELDFVKYDLLGAKCKNPKVHKIEDN